MSTPQRMRDERFAEIISERNKWPRTFAGWPNELLQALIAERARSDRLADIDVLVQKWQEDKAGEWCCVECKKMAVDELKGIIMGDKKPEIVCICGSSRYTGMMAVQAWEFAKQGIIALSCYLLPEWYNAHDDHQAEAEGVAEILDKLHLRKIDMADRVFIMNCEDYIGERTAIEIKYAEDHGKPIEYFYNPVLAQPND